MNRKPRIFIGSSVESLVIADAVNVNLDHDAEVTIWKNGTFELSSNTIDSLINRAKSVDFSLFIFSPDDIAKIRNEEKRTVRDNVIFELGLFIGTLGKERCFILKPRNETLHFPTDLLGVTFADYDADRSDDDMTSAVNAPCTLIKQQMKKLKEVDNIENFSVPKSVTVITQKLSGYDFKVLFELIGTKTECPNGYALFQIKNALGDTSRKTDLSLLKLESLRYIDKKNGTYNNYEQELFFYTLTDSGLNFLLEDEESKTSKKSPPPLDDDILF